MSSGPPMHVLSYTDFGLLELLDYDLFQDLIQYFVFSFSMSTTVLWGLDRAFLLRTSLGPIPQASMMSLIWSILETLVLGLMVNPREVGEAFESLHAS